LFLANTECRLLSVIHPRVGEEALKHLRHDSLETRQPEVHSVRLFIAAGGAWRIQERYFVACLKFLLSRHDFVDTTALSIEVFFIPYITMFNQHISEKRKSIHRSGINVFSKCLFCDFSYLVALDVCLSSASNNIDCSVRLIISFDYANLYSPFIIYLQLKFIPHTSEFASAPSTWSAYLFWYSKCFL